MFNSIISTAESEMTIESALICTAVSLILGLIVAAVYMRQSTYTKSYIITLVILPVLVQAVIMLVNGNLGTAVGIMGAFSLVRFRSMPGSSKEIVGIFLSMAIGVATGMGYITFAALITVVVCAAWLILTFTSFGEKKNPEKDLRITIAENIDYTDIFDDLFRTYTKKHELIKVKTTNMGSMYDLSYRIILNDDSDEKKFIDELRTRNGNLTIVCGRVQSDTETL